MPVPAWRSDWAGVLLLQKGIVRGLVPPRNDVDRLPGVCMLISL